MINKCPNIESESSESDGDQQNPTVESPSTESTVAYGTPDSTSSEDKQAATPPAKKMKLAQEVDSPIVISSDEELETSMLSMGSSPCGKID